MTKKARKKPVKRRKKKPLSRNTSKRKTVSKSKQRKGSKISKKKAPVKQKKTSKKKVKAPSRKFFRLSAERYDEFFKAKEIIGREKIKPGRNIIGKTKWLKPETSDFKTLKQVLNRVSKVKDFTQFSYTLVISFTGPNGNPVNIRRAGRGIPKYNHKKFQANNRKLKAAGLKPLSKEQYFRHVVFDRIRKLIYGSIAEVWGKYPSKSEKAKMNKRQAKKRLDNVRKRDAKFIFILNHENY